MNFNQLRQAHTSAPHEHVHKPMKVEFALAVVITLALCASLISSLSTYVPGYLTPLLILFFLGVKVYHIFKKGGTLIEDYAAIAVIVLFLVLYAILKGHVNATLISVFIVLLFYSAGLMLWVRNTFGSRRVTHFITSYVITIFMIIFLFTGAYLSKADSFSSFGQQETITFEDALYFSTVTLTTVGYGDISPLGINRLLAGFEAFLGMTVNIALLGYVLSSGRRSD